MCIDRVLFVLRSCVLRFSFSILYIHFQLVIANILQTRKNRVIFVTPTTSYEVVLTREQALSGLEIEEPIVADVVSCPTCSRLFCFF